MLINDLILQHTHNFGGSITRAHEIVFLLSLMSRDVSSEVFFIRNFKSLHKRDGQRIMRPACPLIPPPTEVARAAANVGQPSFSLGVSYVMNK